MKCYLLLSLLLLAAAVSAQIPPGMLTGAVTDQNGAPVPNARVTIFSGDTSLFRETRTNANGVYIFENALPIYWMFGVAAPGYNYFENATTAIVGTVIHDAQLEPETEPGKWEIIMNSPEPLGGTDLGVLMPDGRLYFCHNSKDPFYFDPAANDTAWAKGDTKVQGCVAPLLLTDGRVLFAGGTEQEVYGPGTKKVKTFDPLTGQWEVKTNMLDYRWYPSAAQLPNGRLLIVGGGNLNNPQRTKTSELYDPYTNSTVAAGDILYGNEISPMLLLYTGKVLMTHRPPQLFDSKTKSWTLAGDFVQNNRMANSDHSDHELVLLPHGDGRAVAIGFKPLNGAAQKSIVERYDPATDSWSLGADFQPSRSRAKTVFLPNKKILVMGGQKENAADPTPTNQWGYMNLTDEYDPYNDSWRRLAHMNYRREYHANTVLAPDGRVIAVGGEGAPGNEPPLSIIEAFSPPYLFRGVRPVIHSLNKTDFARGEVIEFQAERTDSLTGVVLMSAASVTHFINTGNNRYLDLPFTQSQGAAAAFLPADSLALPYGYYLLFGMVDDIPSVAKIIRVHADASLNAPEPKAGALRLSLAPNPVADRLEVRLSGAQGAVRFSVLDPAGKPLVSVFAQAVPGQVLAEQISVKNLPAGWYVLQAQGPQGAASLPFLKF